MKNLKKIVLGAVVALTLTGAQAAQALTLNGAGSTFDNPIFQKWFYEYNQKFGVQVNYQIGRASCRERV